MKCSVCSEHFKEDDDVVVCPKCGAQTGHSKAPERRNRIFLQREKLQLSRRSHRHDQQQQANCESSDTGRNERYFYHSQHGNS